jgi:hypothetical protein
VKHVFVLSRDRIHLQLTTWRTLIAGKYNCGGVLNGGGKYFPHTIFKQVLGVVYNTGTERWH